MWVWVCVYGVGGYEDIRNQQSAAVAKMETILSVAPEKDKETNNKQTNKQTI